MEFSKKVQIIQISICCMLVIHHISGAKVNSLLLLSISFVFTIIRKTTKFKRLRLIQCDLFLFYSYQMNYIVLSYLISLFMFEFANCEIKNRFSIQSVSAANKYERLNEIVNNNHCGILDQSKKCMLLHIFLFHAFVAISGIF